MELTKELTERNWNDRTGQWDARQKCEYIKQNNTVEIRAISKHVSTTLSHYATLFCPCQCIIFVAFFLHIPN